MYYTNLFEPSKSYRSNPVVTTDSKYIVNTPIRGRESFIH